MSLFNILLSESRDYYAIDDWNTGQDNRISASNSNKSNSEDDTPLKPSYSSSAILSSSLTTFTDRICSNSIIISSASDNITSRDTLPDPLANFTYSYYEKIALAKYWKPINNVGDRIF